MRGDTQGLWLACCAVLDAAGRADLADRLMTHYPQPEEEEVPDV